MNRCVVTLELKTPLWKRVLRFFRLIKKREEFSLDLCTDDYSVGDILHLADGPRVLVVKVSKLKEEFVLARFSDDPFKVGDIIACDFDVNKHWGERFKVIHYSKSTSLYKLRRLIREEPKSSIKLDPGLEFYLVQSIRAEEDVVAKLLWHSTPENIVFKERMTW